MSDCCCNPELCCLLKRYIGQTVTIFTTSGGCSGCGFTGVVIGVDDCFVRLLCRVGGAPACPIGSDCGYGQCNCNEPYFNMGGSCGTRDHKGNDYYCSDPSNLLGSVCEIPLNSIATFCHNAI